MENYQQITKILVWIVVLSTVAYFVLLPMSFTRPNPAKVSPEKTKEALQANPFGALNINQYPAESSTSTTSSEELKLPEPLMQLGE